MSKGREFYQNTTQIKAYHRAAFWHEMWRRKTTNKINAYLNQNNPPHVKTYLKNAIHKENIARRKKERRQAKINAINNSAPLVQNSYILKWCICIVMIMCILTFNTTGEIGLDNQIEYYDYDIAEVREEREYTESFYEEQTGLNKIVNMCKSVEVYGQNSSWTEIINSFSNIKSFKTGIEAFGTMCLLPINLTINFGTFFINLFNSWTGKEIITPFKLKFATAIERDITNVISFPNLYNTIFG